MPTDLFGTDDRGTSPPTPPVAYARIAPDHAVDAPEGLTYAIPPSLADLAPGDRVLIPLGRSNTPSPGIVIERINAQATDDKVLGIEVRRIKPITERRPGHFPTHLIPLAEWIARYYCAPLGTVLATMQPAAVKKQIGTKRVTHVVLSGSEPLGDLPPSAGAAWELIRQRGEPSKPMTTKQLRDVLGLRTVGPLNVLIKAGVLRERSDEVVRAAWPARPRTPDSAHPLTPEQHDAVHAITGGLGTFSPFLLFGVTGSGKTEVYLSALHAALARGESCIVLVPEIALTPQTAGRFEARFADSGIAVLHSGLTAAQRHFEWSRVARGEARVVIGARSAVFSPLAHRDGPGSTAPLGLIVVDEEHDGSYKQDQAPRYHARDVAVRRAQLAGCPIVLGSATPSLESWSNAHRVDAGDGGARRGFALLSLPRRVGGGRLPRVDVVDLNEERARRTTDRHMLHALGPTLESALRVTLDEGGQAILLLNRRGYAHYIACADPGCGWVLECDHCDATLVEHRSESNVSRGRASAVRCHHCLAERLRPSTCPSCGKKVTRLGFGTQRVEDELAGKFDELVMGETLLRLDSDSMRTAKHYFDALERFGRGEVRVLLGTQMLAKGLDYPNVRLVGVVNADTAINMPDFRAGERTFQLVAQVAGRAGRGAVGGSGCGARVIVQTMNPHDPSIVSASRHDFPAFASREMVERAAACLPPAHRMARIVVRDVKADRAESRCWSVYRAAGGLGLSSLTVRPPSPCAMSRVSDQYRWCVDLHAPGAALIQRALASLRGQGEITSDARMTVDVDPVALL